MISAPQIKAARALLDWSQDDLAAAASLSRTTIRSVELGYAVRPGNIREIYRTFEINGLEFLEGDGVRRQPEGNRDYTGYDSCDRFFEHVQQTVKQDGRELLCVVESQDILNKASGTSHKTNIQRLENIQKITNVKCLITYTNMPNIPSSSFDVRLLPEAPSTLPFSTFIFGNQLAFCCLQDPSQFTFVLLQKISPSFCRENYFMPRWNLAKVIQETKKINKSALGRPSGISSQMFNCRQ